MKYHDVIVGGIYEHYKTGKKYVVVEIGTHSEDLEELVIYYAPDDISSTNKIKLWVRPKEMFEEGVVVYRNGTVIVPRFKLIHPIPKGE
jgi:hypothetical protein